MQQMKMKRTIHQKDNLCSQRPSRNDLWAPSGTKYQRMFKNKYGILAVALIAMLFNIGFPLSLVGPMHESLVSEGLRMISMLYERRTLKKIKTQGNGQSTLVWWMQPVVEACFQCGLREGGGLIDSCNSRRASCQALVGQFCLKVVSPSAKNLYPIKWDR
ncbi:hypothetical protein Nepgr_028457 [Nepenthes gracilis]|uniref:Uncharacterized protein n=1 Tax=Nepenthes gracilis TaxID=150966 RepID=A0AAD3TCX8_NEPGR|nr:hypothetical protein Nepgr_028457 [Nepenthes gracilis]